jgi:hypothetical protein
MWLDKLQKTEALYNAYVDNYNKLQELYEANDELASYDLETYYTQVCDEPSVVETRELERAILSEKVSVQSYLQRRVKDAQSLLDQLKKDTSRTVMFINSFVTSFFSTSRFGLVVAGGFVVVLFVLLNCCSGMSTASEVASKKHLLSIAFFTLVICFIVGCIFWPIIQGGLRKQQEADQQKAVTAEKTNLSTAMQQWDATYNKHALVFQNARELAKLDLSKQMLALGAQVKATNEALINIYQALKQYTDEDPQLPKEADWCLISCIVDYAKRGYADNLKEALLLCHNDAQHAELMQGLQLQYQAIVETRQVLAGRFDQLNAEIAALYQVACSQLNQLKQNGMKLDTINETVLEGNERLSQINDSVKGLGKTITEVGAAQTAAYTAARQDFGEFAKKYDYIHRRGLTWY